MNRPKFPSQQNLLSAEILEPFYPSRALHLSQSERDDNIIQVHYLIPNFLILGESPKEQQGETNGVGKRTKHMDMNLTEEEKEKWHKEHPPMTAEKHGILMKKMGISEEDDKRWHKEKKIPQENFESDSQSVNPYVIGDGFLNYCIDKGWLRQEGKGRNSRYYIIETGKEELRKFGLKL